MQSPTMKWAKTAFTLARTWPTARTEARSHEVRIPTSSWKDFQREKAGLLGSNTSSKSYRERTGLLLRSQTAMIFDLGDRCMVKRGDFDALEPSCTEKGRHVRSSLLSSVRDPAGCHKGQPMQWKGRIQGQNDVAVIRITET